jgi:hypothetical protein
MHAFEKDNVNQVILKLKNGGFTGVNLALNYHASRDIFLSSGPELVYLEVGFHYYKPNDTYYRNSRLFPKTEHSFKDSHLLEIIVEKGIEFDFEINGWAVYFHNREIARDNPEFTITNVFGNNFLTDLCPSSPEAQNYAFSMSQDLCTRGIKCLLLESIRFHDFSHGFHHERLFINLSAISKFLFYLCFCKYCESNFTDAGFNPLSLKKKIIEVLFIAFNSERDPWLNLKLSKNLLAEVVGIEILDFLQIRESTLTGIYSQIGEICKVYDVVSKFLDPSALLDGASENPLENSWISGLCVNDINQVIDICEGVFFSDTSRANSAVYRRSLTKTLGASLSSLYPFTESRDQIGNLVDTLITDGFSEFDFYAYDLMTKNQFLAIVNTIKKFI